MKVMKIIGLDRVSRTLLALLVAFSTIHPGPIHAQSGKTDIEGPTIEHEVVESGGLGKVQEFSATVVDNEEVASVWLFYRFGVEDDFDAR